MSGFFEWLPLNKAVFTDGINDHGHTFFHGIFFTFPSMSFCLQSTEVYTFSYLISEVRKNDMLFFQLEWIYLLSTQNWVTFFQFRSRCFCISELIGKKDLIFWNFCPLVEYHSTLQSPWQSRFNFLAINYHLICKSKTSFFNGDNDKNIEFI